jgi:tail tube protein
MSFQPQRMYDVKWAFSNKKQVDYTTLVADNDLNQHLAVIGADVAEVGRTSYSDDKQYGKGHEFPTAFRELTREMKLSRTMDLSSLMAGWAAAFGMGNVVVSQPNPSNNPTAFRHVVTFFDASLGKQVPVTTIYEQVLAQPSFERRLESLAVSDFTITGKSREVAQLQLSFVGSGKTTNGSMTVPSLTPVSVFDSGGLVFKLGPQGAPVDLSSRLLDFTVKVTQNLDLQNAYSPGGGLYASRMWAGARRATFDAQLHLDSANTDLLDDFINASLLEVSFKFSGDLILAGQPEKHDCEIKFPAVRISALPVSAQGDLLVYRISAGDTDVYKDAGGTPNEPLQITVTNTVPAYLGT